MSISPRLTKTDAGDYDLLLEDGSFQMCSDGTEAACHAVTRILIFKGEESLNGEIEGREDTGTYWYQTMFPTDKTKAEKEFHIKKRILETPGNDRLEDFTWTQVEHSLSITGRVITPWGDIELPTTITPL